MNTERDNKQYDAPAGTDELLKDTPSENEVYSLDDILAEFGRGAAEPAQTENEEPQKPELTAMTEDTVPLPNLKDILPEKPEEPPAPEEAPAPPEEEPAPEEDNTPPDRVSLKNLMASTVDAVLSENDDAILETRRPLSQRLKNAVPRRRARSAAQQDTEQLWQESPEESEEEPLLPEPEPEEAYRAQKRRSKHLRRGLWLLALPAVLAIGVTVAEALGYMPALWMQDNRLRGGVPGGLVALSMLLATDVWRDTAAQLMKRRITCGLGAFVVCLVTLVNCLLLIWQETAGALPFAAAAAVLIWVCQWGLYLTAEARREAYTLVNMGGEPPYTVSATEVGVCKQRGKLEGFFRITEKPDPVQEAQNYLIPLLLAIATVLCGVVCIGDKKTQDFFWVWSAMLTVSMPLSLPLTGALPLARLQKRLRSGGSAVAGWWGARGMRSKNRLIITEKDVFPPGTVEFNGYKVFGEERRKMISYAATVTHAAHSQLEDLFAQQLVAEGGFRTALEELRFYEDGGVGGTIHGESILMGSAYFMRQKHVALPHDLKLQTGVYLAVDGVLGAIFVIKYQPSRNVEWALRALGRAHIRPVLAVRSGNVTPGLLRRKFSMDTHPVYPDVGTRLALSDAMENVGESANAVLYREGLMPLAETVIGAKRMRRAVAIGSVLAYLGAVAGLLLCYYFTHMGAYGALEPLYMLGFLLLWLLPTLLLGGLVKHF